MKQSTVSSAKATFCFLTAILFVWGWTVTHSYILFLPLFASLLSSYVFSEEMEENKKKEAAEQRLIDLNNDLYERMY